MGSHRRRGTQAHLKAGKHTLDQPVKPHLLEMAVIRFHADPAVVVKHIGAFTKAVDDVRQLLRERSHKPLYKGHPVQLYPAWHIMPGAAPAAPDKIFRGNGIAIFRLKCIHHPRAHAEIVAGPVREQITVSLAAPPDPREIVKQRGKAHDIRMWVLLTPLGSAIALK